MTRSLATLSWMLRAPRWQVYAIAAAGVSIVGGFGYLVWQRSR